MKPRQFKKAILHVGPDKTGSTAIQFVCNANRTLLLQHGVYYPSGNWHAELGSCFCEFPEKYVFNSSSNHINHDWIRNRDISYLDNLRLELEQVSGNVLVFSYEGFVDLDMAALARFKEFVGEYSEQCEVVFYARSPFSYTVSAMSQRVKSGRSSWPDDTPIITPSRDFLEKFTEVFGKECLNVRKYSRDALPQGDVVLDFMSLLNIPVELCNQMSTQSSQQNESISIEALLIGDKILEILAGRILSNSFEVLFSDVLSRIKGGKISLNTQQKASVAREAKPHLDYLADKFGITFDSENKQKVSSKTKKISPIGKETVDSLASIITELILPGMKPQRVINTSSFLLHGAVLRNGNSIMFGKLLIFDVDFFVSRTIAELETGIHIYDSKGQWAFGTNSSLQKKSFVNVSMGSHRVSHYVVAELPAGRYRAGFGFKEIVNNGFQDLAWRDTMCEFIVVNNSEPDFAGYACLKSDISLEQTALADNNLLITAPTGSITPIATLESVKSNEQCTIMVAIQNSSDQLWLGDCFRPVRISYHWYDLSGNKVLFNGLRTNLPDGGIAANYTVELEMLVQSPTEPGCYILELTLVQETVCWFEDRGFIPTRLEVVVE